MVQKFDVCRVPNEGFVYKVAIKISREVKKVLKLSFFGWKLQNVATKWNKKKKKKITLLFKSKYYKSL